MKQLYRVDAYTEDVVLVDVEDDAPVGVWLEGCPPLNNLHYRYELSERAAYKNLSLYYKILADDYNNKSTMIEQLLGDK